MGWQLGAILHSSNEPGELSQWLCHDDSTNYYYYYALGNVDSVYSSFTVWTPPLYSLKVYMSQCPTLSDCLHSAGLIVSTVAGLKAGLRFNLVYTVTSKPS